MQIDSVDQIPQIVNSTGFSIFVFPRDYEYRKTNIEKPVEFFDIRFSTRLRLQ